MMILLEHKELVVPALELTGLLKLLLIVQLKMMLLFLVLELLIEIKCHLLDKLLVLAQEPIATRK
jgi:hypothetical protein